MIEIQCNQVDQRFARNLASILNKGTEDVNPRPKYADGVPAHSRFITQVCETYDISKGEFPITNLRQIPWKSGIKEVLWIYQDQSNDLNLLADKYGVTWWDDWDIGDRTIGQRYGAVVAEYNLIDELLFGLVDNPYGRRHIIDMYQYADLQATAGLHPCAFMTMWTVRDGYLDMTLVQRSSDYCTAGHINKMQYVALQMMVARHCGYEVGKFTHFVQNLHIYDRHVEQADELIDRYIDNQNLPQARLVLNPEKTNFYDFTIDDFTLEGYEPVKPQLKFELGI